MLHQEFKNGPKDIGIIVGPKYYNFTDFIGRNYGIPLKRLIPDVPQRMITISTFEPQDKKINKKQLVEHCADLLESVATMGIDKLLISSADYFKYLSGQKDFEGSIGLIYQCVVEGYEYITVCPCINPAVLNAQPNKKPLLDKALDTFGKLVAGTYNPPEEFKFETYGLITTAETLKPVLEMLKTKPQLAVDIETTGLRVGEAEVLTIAFAWDKYNAVTVACHDFYGVDQEQIVGMLKDFLRNYNGNTIYHNSLFDLKQMAYCWWMKDFSNYEGLYEAMEDLGVKRVHDTMLLAYAELNSTERPPLGLKVLAKDFLGDWGIDTKNNLELKLEDLAVYNAQDVCGTLYVYEKFKHQEDSRGYKEILQPSIKPLLHMMCNGLPIDLEKVQEADVKISEELDKAKEVVANSRFTKETEENLNYYACEKYNATHKGQKEPWQFDSEFNPNSAVQLRTMLFDVMGFEPVEFTDTGAGKTDRASIKEFLSLCPEDDERIELLKALISISETAIVQNTFISAFKELSLADKDGNYSLHGNLRLGGTQSCRLSSSEPNLQNLPSGSEYGEAIKNCFVAPENYIIAYADFSALESRIGAILSGDINSTRQYTEDIDGHSMNTAAMMREELEERGIFIDMSSAESINRIKTEAKDLRNGSKKYTFGLQYGCGPGKIQQMLKGSRERAEGIYNAFHKLYSGLAEFSKTNELFAKKHGYIQLAFGLQLKTPRINSRDNGVASAEARSGSNAASQSYGMLMNRTFIELLDRLEKSEFKYDIKIVNTIHDSLMLLVKKDINAIHWVNENLVECMNWKDDPELLKSPVTLEAEVDFGSSWYDLTTVKNNVSKEEIAECLVKYL